MAAPAGPRPYDVPGLLRAPGLTAVQAPMVRYSRLPFRKLCAAWGVDISYTHMILADCFVKSPQARDAELATEVGEGPLVVQFAAPEPVQLGRAAVLVRPYCDAVDLNCGCPQRWALKEGVGGALMASPELVQDMVRQVVNQAGADLPCTVKMRVRETEAATVDFARQMAAAGAAWLTVHGRTVGQRSSVAVDEAVVRLVRQAVDVPVVHNGDVFTLADATRFHAATQVHGVMAARGLLFNPALFRGYDRVPPECIAEFVDLSMRYGTQFRPFHHHVSCMLKDTVPRAARLEFQRLTSVAGVLQFLDGYGVVPRPLDRGRTTSPALPPTAA